MELDKLLVKIEADLSNLKKGMAQAQDITTKSSRGMSKNFGNMMRSIDGLGKQVLKYGSIFAGVFGVLAVKKIINVGMSIENLEVQLKNLFGSAEEGAKAFQIMSEYAGQVPFELSQIQKGAGSLAAVAKRADDLNELLFITGNVASVTGLDFAKTAEQIQRSFSSGIASADLFREKAVKSLLGFTGDSKAGIEETQTAFRNAFGRGGTFAKASQEFALTLTGTISMLSDKMFNFQKAIADGFFAELKGKMNNLNNQLAVNQKKIMEFGKEIGKSIGESIKFVARNIDRITASLKALAIIMGSAVFVTFGLWLASLRGLFTIATTFVIYFAKEIKELHDSLRDLVGDKAIQAWILATTGRFVDLTEATTKQVQPVFDVAKAWQTLLEIQEKLGITGPEMSKKQQQTVDQLKDKINKVFTEIDDVMKDFTQNTADAFGNAIAKGEKFGDAMKTIFKDVVAEVVSLIVRILVLEPLLARLTTILTGIRDQINKTIDDMYELSFSSMLNFGINTALAGATGTPPTGQTPGISGKAHGGFVKPNTPYMVGERGPELFVPTGAGNIQSNGGGGVTINQNLNFSTGVQQTVRAEVMGLMPQIKDQTVKAVAETRSRGGSFARTFGA